MTVSQYNFRLGDKALNSVTTASACLAIGDGALESQKTGNNVIALGVVAAKHGVDLADCVIVGVKAARFAKTGVGGTVCGFRALEHADSVLNNTAIGDSCLWHTQGGSNDASGYVCGEGMSRGSWNVIHGPGACRYRDDGDENVFLGALAGAILSNSLKGTPGFKIGVGDAKPGDDIGGAKAGHRNVGAGTKSLGNYRGNEATAVGHQAGLSMAGTADTSFTASFLGANSGNNPCQKVDANNSTALGANTYTDKDNQVVIGNASVTEFVLAGVTITKTQIEDLLALLCLPSATNRIG